MQLILVNVIQIVPIVKTTTVLGLAEDFVKLQFSFVSHDDVQRSLVITDGDYLAVQRSCTLQEEGNEPEPTVAVPEEPVQPTEEGLSRETEIIVVVVSVVGGVLIVLLIVAIVLLARRKRAQYTQIGNNDAPNE